MKSALLLTVIALLAAVFASVSAASFPPGLGTGTPPGQTPTTAATIWPTATQTSTPTVTPTPQLVRWTSTPTPIRACPYTGQREPGPECDPTSIPVFVIPALPRGMTYTRIDSYPR